MSRKPQDILDVSPDDLGRWLEDRREPRYRLDQVLKCLYGDRVASFSEMTTLPLRLRTLLAEAFRFPVLKETGRLTSHDRASVKLAFELEDGEEIESVCMKDGDHLTFCISSQAGCALKCRFCATGAGGFGRNLETGEILGQVLALARGNGWPANVVFMGMGEPLLNPDAVEAALQALVDPRRFGLGARRITLSTAGITPEIRKLAECPVRPNLALSLNSPFDAERSRLMPVNRQHPLAGALDACEEYARRTGRRVSLEYVLLGGVNTSPAAARAVAEIARSLHAMVNLIAFNPVPGCGFHPPGRDEADEFKAVLREAGVQVTQRFRRGRDILAACGQLRGKHPRRAAPAAECPSGAGEQSGGEPHA